MNHPHWERHNKSGMPEGHRYVRRRTSLPDVEVIQYEHVAEFVRSDDAELACECVNLLANVARRLLSVAGLQGTDGAPQGDGSRKTPRP